MLFLLCGQSFESGFIENVAMLGSGTVIKPSLIYVYRYIAHELYGSSLNYTVKKRKWTSIRRMIN